MHAPFPSWIEYIKALLSKARPAHGFDISMEYATDCVKVEERTVYWSRDIRIPLTTCQALYTKSSDKDDFEKRILEYFWGVTPSQDGAQLPLGLTINSNECQHSWKKYEGFSENYYYCIHCDTKEFI